MSYRYELQRKFEAGCLAWLKDAYNREKARWTDILICRAEEKLVPVPSYVIEMKEATTPWNIEGPSMALSNPWPAHK